MALGNVTRFSPNPDFVAGNKKFKFRQVQLTSGANYTTGGETLTPALVGLKRIEHVIPLGLAQTTSGTTSRSVSVKRQVNGDVKLLVQTTASAEATGSSDQSTFVQDLLILGH